MREMSNLIKALVAANGRLTALGDDHYWSVNEIREVDDSVIAFYQSHSDAFTVLSTDVMEDIYTGEAFDAGKIAVAYIDFNGVFEAGETITIGGVVYTEADTAVAATGVFTNGASAAASAASFLAAVNGDLRATVPFTGVAAVAGDGVFLVWDAVGTAGNVTITTTSSSNCTVQNSLGGEVIATQQSLNLVYTVTTQALLAGELTIPLPFAPVGFHVSAFSATGAPILFTDLVTIEDTPDRLLITTTGGTNLANTNVLNVTVFS